jgi:hypothetical protein
VEKKANVAYTMSAWVRASSGCKKAYLMCTYESERPARGEQFTLVPEEINEWQQFSTTCTFIQEQFEAGDLFMLVGFDYQAGSNAYIDTVRFTL